jgi:hypothetical protein
LRKVSEIERQNHLEVKQDIYGYAFRSLAKILRSLYSFLAERHDDVTISLNALRILCHFVHDILFFKDTIAKWRVSVSQRYKGDRIIQDVVSRLIIPLRRAESMFSKRLSLLEDKERRRRQHAEMCRQAEEDESNAKRIEEDGVAERKRWQLWQQLHITRMQCEPDPCRRRHLIITKLEDLEEVDANGVKFERVPVFKNRNTPSQRWASSMTEEKVWSVEQETALLEGLQDLVGQSTYIVRYVHSC